MIIFIFKSSNSSSSSSRQPLSQLLVNDKSADACDSMVQQHQQQTVEQHLESTAKFSVNQSSNFVVAATHTTKGVDESDQSSNFDPGKLPG